MRIGILSIGLLVAALSGCGDGKTASSDDVAATTQNIATAVRDDEGNSLEMTFGDETYDMIVFVCGGSGYIFNLSASVDPHGANNPIASITATEIAEAADQPLERRANARLEIRTPGSIDLWASEVITEYDHTGRNITISGEMQGLRHPVAEDGTQLWEGIEKIDGGATRPFSITTSCED